MRLTVFQAGWPAQRLLRAVSATQVSLINRARPPCTPVGGWQNRRFADIRLTPAGFSGTAPSRLPASTISMPLTPPPVCSQQKTKKIYRMLYSQPHQTIQAIPHLQRWLGRVKPVNRRKEDKVIPPGRRNKAKRGRTPSRAGRRLTARR